MTENKNPNSNGQPLSPLDQAAHSLRHSRIPHGPPESLLLSTIARLNTETTISHSPKKGWFTMRNVARYALAASLLILVSLSLMWALLGRGTASAFAVVLQHVHSATAVRCTVSVSAADPAAPQDVSMLMVDPGWLITDAKGMKYIFSTEDHKMVMLTESTKQAIVIDMKNKPVGAPQNFNMLEEFKNVDSKDSKPLGDRDIGTIYTKGYLVEKNGLTMKIWADTKTALPVLVEVSSHGLIQFDGAFSNFDWNASYDASELSVDVPAGYSTVTADIDASAPKEHDVIVMLQQFADLNNGVLPPNIGMEGFTSVLTAKIKPDTIDPNHRLSHDDEHKLKTKLMADAMKYAAPIGRGWAFITSEKCGTSWYYAPNVKLGQKDSPVLWYKPTVGGTSTTWRVIYADLTIQDVPESALPNIPTAAKVENLMKIPAQLAPLKRNH